MELSGSRGKADVLDFEASLGVRFEWVLHVGNIGVWPDPTRLDGATRRGAGYISKAAGLDDLLHGTRPRVCFFGHHHSRFDASVDGIQCVSLNKVGMPGNLVAIDLDERDMGWSIVAEWPERR